MECVEGLLPVPGAARPASSHKICGVSPHRVLAVTFTNKAAREMKGRVCRMLGDQAEGIMLGTFHAICASILRRSGWSGDLYDDSDQMSLITRCG